MHPGIGTTRTGSAAGLPGRSARLIALALVTVVIASILAVGAVPVSATAASTAPVSANQEFDPGYLIDDADFYTASAMTEEQIQAFLDARETGTCGNTLCLKQLALTTANRSVAPAKDGTALCAPYTGAANELAAQIIYRVEQACGISAKVILVTLQKEQSLVTSLAPTSAALQRAMGYACPDSGTCAPTTLGFQNQVYVAASQLKRYSHSTTFDQPGPSSVRYSPKAGCGRKSFVVTNYATAALYNYTPYTPDAAALATLTRAGDTCSSYGNRNFALYYREWFGGPTGDPQGAVKRLAMSNSSVTLSGWAVDPNAPGSAVTVRVRGVGWSEDITANELGFASLKSFAGAGLSHGFSTTVLIPAGSQSVCVDALNRGSGHDVTLGCIAVAAPETSTGPVLAGFLRAAR